MNHIDRPAAVTARACANVALVKYWGKVDEVRRVPATGSLSVTLAGLTTETTVAFAEKKGGVDSFHTAHARRDPKAGADSFRAVRGGTGGIGGAQDAKGGRAPHGPPDQPDLVVLDSRPVTGREAARVASFLDRVRARAAEHGHPLGAASVRTVNYFPTAAGLASSASGFAALAGAAVRAAGLDASQDELAELARLGSASAARSVHGGFVELVPYQEEDGSWNARTAQVASEHHWDLRVLVAVVDAGYKPIGSTAAMARSAATSSFYPAWLDNWGADLTECREAIAARDLERLASVAEHSALKLHALTTTSRPPVQFLRGPSVEIIHEVWALRSNGILCGFTADAGPNIKVLCEPPDEDTVRAALLSVHGIQTIRDSSVGGPIEVEPHDVDPGAAWGSAKEGAG